jgi:hypothetical protein
MVGLVAAIVWMYLQRTRPEKRRAQAPPAAGEYEAGYK